MSFPDDICRRLTIPMVCAEAGEAGKVVRLVGPMLPPTVRAYADMGVSRKGRCAFVIAYEGALIGDDALELLLDGVAGRVADLLDAPHPDALALRWLAEAVEAYETFPHDDRRIWTPELRRRYREPMRLALKEFRAPGWRRPFQVFGRDTFFVAKRGGDAVVFEVSDRDLVWSALEVIVISQPGARGEACRFAAAALRAGADAAEATGSRGVLNF